MKIRFLMPILVLAAQTAGATTFNLPAAAPVFSITMPGDWVTEETDDVITSRPPKDSKVIVRVFPVTGAKNLEEAFTTGLRQAGVGYSNFKAGKTEQEKEAGMEFMTAACTGRKEDVDIRIFVYVFSPDAQHFFAVTQAADQAGGENFGRQMDRVMGSIKSLKDADKK